jgi:hypothetical protein
MSVQKNIQAYQDKLAEVESHCMCASFEDRGGQYRVLYPAGMILDGVQATYAECGKLVALDRMLNAMERHWKESGI